MKPLWKLFVVGLMWLLVLEGRSQTVQAPFTEEFATDTANWKDFASLDVTRVASGGPDGSAYVTSSNAFTNAVMGSVIQFRGHDMFNSSGDAFVGDWLAADIGRLSAYVRHNGPEPLAYFARLATPFNFPGVIIGSPTAVQPNAWTLVEFEISQSNPLLTVEGPPSNYSATLSNVGNVQFGARVPSGQETNATLYTFDLDQVTIVPEPASVLLVAAAAGVVLLGRSRRRR